MKKLLYAPAARLIASPASLLTQIKNILRQPALLYDGELIFCGDIPLILGKENTYVLDGIHQHLHDKNVPTDCPYPSCHGTTPGTTINTKQLATTIRNIDAVLLSSRSPHAQLVIKTARQYNKLIAIIDFPDHENLYGKQQTIEEIYCGYKPNSDFDIYFKKDLMPDLVNDTTLPLAPSPVRPSSYNIPSLDPTSPIFYSGRSRMEKVQPERAEAVTLFKKYFPKADIAQHDDRSSFMTTTEYWKHLTSSNLALSPSGRVWDSYRHCEVGLTPHTALIAPVPYIATAGTKLEDKHNAILYQTKEKNGQYHLTNPDELIDKVEYYLSHLSELETIAAQWKKDVLATHTIKTRSQYIISTIGNIM